MTVSRTKHSLLWKTPIPLLLGPNRNPVIVAPPNKTQDVLVITDGDRCFILGEEITNQVIPQDTAISIIKEAALEKLTPEEKKVLGL